ncbi:MAG: hypothetical protein ACRDBO_19435 [Lachnospiraceae bacterium]
MPTLSAMFRLNDGYNSTINRVVTGTDRATRSIEQASRGVDTLDNRLLQASGSSSAAAAEIAALKQKVYDLNKKIEQMGERASGSEGKVLKLLKTLGGFAALKKLFDFGKDSFGESNATRNAEAQLKVVLANVGAAEDAFDRLSQKAESVQDGTIYARTSMLAGAGELATYISDTDAIEHMMGTLSNYAAGMSGGGEVDNKAMVDYATQLGKALDGTFDGLKKKGFELTEAQKKIIENGSDMEKALVIDEVINQSWAGLAEAMANLPENRIIRLKNAIGGIKDEVGNKLMPALMRLVQMFETNLPTIEGMMLGLGTVMGLVVDGLSLVAEGVMNVAGFFIDNWSIIAPIIMGVVAALIVYNAVMGIGWLTTMKDIAAKAVKIAMDWAETAAILAMIVAQDGLNAALAACPITWIVIAVIALVAVFYAAVAAVNKFKESSISATGLIGAAIGGFVANFINYFIMLYNVVAEFINFFANVWSSPVESVKILFYGLASTVIGYVVEMAKAIETIINRIPGVEVSITAGLESFKGKIEAAAAEAKDATGWTEVVSKKDFVSGADAANKGYDIGSNIESKIGAGIDGLFDTSPYEFDSTGLGGDLGSGGNPATVKGTGAGGAVKVENEEDIEWMRKLAERDYVARIAQNTLAPNIKVEFTGPITKEADVDGVAARMGELLKEQIATAPEGVYG